MCIVKKKTQHKTRELNYIIQNNSPLRHVQKLVKTAQKVSHWVSLLTSCVKTK